MRLADWTPDGRKSRDYKLVNNAVAQFMVGKGFTSSGKLVPASELVAWMEEPPLSMSRSTAYRLLRDVPGFASVPMEDKNGALGYYYEWEYIKPDTDEKKGVYFPRNMLPAKARATLQYEIATGQLEYIPSLERASLKDLLIAAWGKIPKELKTEEMLNATANNFRLTQDVFGPLPEYFFDSKGNRRNDKAVIRKQWEGMFVLALSQIDYLHD